MISNKSHVIGDRSEGVAGWLRKMSNDLGYVVFSTDWYGMSTYDVLVLVRILLSDPSHFAILTGYIFILVSLIVRKLGARICK